MYTRVGRFFDNASLKSERVLPPTRRLFLDAMGVLYVEHVFLGLGLFFQEPMCPRPSPFLARGWEIQVLVSCVHVGVCGKAKDVIYMVFGYGFLINWINYCF